MSEPVLVCCGVILPPGVGKYGCPNCNGDNVARPAPKPVIPPPYKYPVSQP